MPSHLRVFPAHDETHDFEKRDNDELSVRIRLGDLMPLVAMAQKMHFIWLKDFLDDEVCISPDLHDVLQAFRGISPLT